MSGLPRLLYDADCGFCSRCAAWLQRGSFDLRVEPSRGVDLAGLDVDADRARTEIPYVGVDGRVRYGADAIAAALTSGPRRWRVVGHVLARPPLRWVAGPIYAAVARNRHRLPGGTAACALEP